jgi:rod shape-determining protein MreD
MKRFILPALLLFLFTFEGTFVDIVPVIDHENNRIFVPHFMIVLVIFIAIYMGYIRGMIFGFVFGLLFDIVYTGIIGVHAFIIPLITYIMAKLSGAWQTNIFISSFLVILGIVIIEFFVFGVNYAIGYTTMPVDLFLHTRLIPTIILNSIFVLLVCYPTKRLLTKLSIVE